MAQIINLTIARNIFDMWQKLSKINPYKADFKNILAQLVVLPEFANMVKNNLMKELTVENVDLVCHIIEKYYNDYVDLLDDKNHILYIKRRIENCRAVIKGKQISSYNYAFPEIKLNESDPRASFLLQVVDFVGFIQPDHQTIQELLNTPFFQYEQMVQYISYFPNEKIPLLLEKLSYVDKKNYAKMTIVPIGNYKNNNSLEALENLEKYYMDHDQEILPIIYQTMQKLVFHQPAIV